MILEKSLHPALVRRGVSGEVRHAIARCSIGDFNESVERIWLPPDTITEREHAAINVQIEKDAPYIGNIALGSVGCWLAPDSEITPMNTLYQIATTEVGNKPLNTTIDMPKLRLCDEECCVYGRHYDITFSCLSQRRALLEPNEHHYRTMLSGEIATIWGDTLPSVKTSAALLRELQLRCPPYTSEKTSPLTAHNIGQITIHDLTGCWLVRSFYTRPGYQYDGYGRLGRRAHMAPKGAKVRSMQMLAHRVMWQVMGNTLQKGEELNHLCGHRPCANPLHLIQVSKNENGLHSHRMQRAINKLPQLSLPF